MPIPAGVWSLAIYLAGRLGRFLAALLLGGAITGWVAARAGAGAATAVVHPTEAKVVISVDDQEVYYASRHEPAPVFELASGWHILRMTRGDRVLYEQEFEVVRGQEVVLTAHRPRRHRGRPSDK